MKKVLTLVLALVMALGVTAVAWATEGEAAQIGETKYASLQTALEKAKSGETVVLLDDITIEGPNGTLYGLTDGVTIDLNGHKIDGSNVGLGRSNPAALGLNVEVSGSAGVITITNSNTTTKAAIVGYVPLQVGSMYSDPLKVEIGDNVELVTVSGGDGNGIKMDSSTYVLYNTRTEAYFTNGGFKVTVGEEDRIYCDFASAADLANGTTATLLHNYTGSESIKVKKYGKGNTSFTLDLNNKVYTYTGGKTYGIVNIDCAKTITVKNGTLVNTNVEQQAGVKLEVTGAGAVLDNVTVKVAGYYGAATNGNNTNNTVKLVNSRIEAPNGVGVFFPSSGTLTVDGGSIEANTGVQVCAGSLVIKGAPAIIATGDGTGSAGSSGSVLDGAAVSIISRAGYNALDGVSIVGGTFTAANGVDTVQAYSVSDGTKTEWAGAAEKVVISGGTFGTDVTEYRASGKLVRVEPAGGAVQFVVVDDSEDIQSGTYTTITVPAAPIPRRTTARPAPRRSTPVWGSTR